MNLVSWVTVVAMPSRCDWPIASFRDDAEFGRFWNEADIARLAYPTGFMNPRPALGESPSRLS